MQGRWLCLEQAILTFRIKPADAARAKKLALNDGVSVQRHGASFYAAGRRWYSYWLHKNVLPAFKNLTCSYTVDRQHFERRQDLKIW